MSKPRILISNDDGITAPGLRALAAALHQDGFCTFAVSAPAGERSAQSHCITVGKHLHAWQLDVEGAEEAFAVDGTPADSVMLALYGPLLASPSFQLVVSGINRGDNCGLHVIYSGTDVPSIAVSLDNYLARTQEQYEAAATYTLALIKAVLGVLPAPRRHTFPTSNLAGRVINVNVPKGGVADIRGFFLAEQGVHCHFPDWQEMDADPHYSEGHAGAVTLRAFRNAAGSLRGDLSQGCDSWAVGQGWVAVTPLALRSDMPLTAVAASQREQPQLLLTVAAAMQAAAQHLGVQVGGIPRHLEAANADDAASNAVAHERVHGDCLSRAPAAATPPTNP